MNAIKNIRKNTFAISQREFAKICDVDQGTVSRWESDDSDRYPDLSHMGKIRSYAIEKDIQWSDTLFFDKNFEI